MIYASIKAIDAWHTKLTPASYLLFSAAGGTLAASFFAAAGAGPWAALAVAGILLLAAAWAAKARLAQTVEPNGRAHAREPRLGSAPSARSAFRTASHQTTIT